MVHRSLFPIDLSGVDRNVFLVIGHARALLIGQTLDRFDDDVIAAIMPGAGKTYKDILALVNQYVQIVDTSRTYPEYTLDESAVIEAIERLNRQIKTLPDTIPTLLEDLWPESGSECGFKNYVSLLEQEIERVEDSINNREPFQPLLDILNECLEGLKGAL